MGMTALPYSCPAYLEQCTQELEFQIIYGIILLEFQKK